MIGYEDSITPKGAPNIPGLGFRRYRGDTDLPGIVKVFNTCKTLDGLERIMSFKDVKRLFII